VRILFIGGEPLLEFPLIRRAVAYVEQARPHGTTVRYHIVTNGTLLREEQADFLADNDFKVGLSFDGVPAAQDLRGPGTFAVLDRLLDRLRVERPVFFTENLSVGLTLLPSTIPFLADSIEYFLGKDVRRLGVSPAITHQPWQDPMMAALEAQFARVFRACLRHYRGTGTVPFELFRRERGEARRPRRVSMCGAGRGETPAVDVDGQVHGCLTFVDSYQRFPTAFLRTRLESMRMGDLRDPALADRMAAYPEAARRAGIFDAKQDKFSSYGRCGECRYLGTCGVCPTSIGHQPGHADPNRIPDFQCAYNLVSLKYRSRFPYQPSAAERLREGPMPERFRALFGLTRTARRGSAPRRQERPWS
jgi:radical SAM protein with 4Fe4S-binding SPASM domain